MRSRLTNKIALLITASASLSAVTAHASRVAAEGVPAACAVLDSFSGSVQVLDSSRSTVSEAEKNGGVPCGGWVSVGHGAAVLVHRDGYKFHLASGSFVQLLEPNADGKRAGDAVVVFKGQVFAESVRGGAELRIITANGRARLPKGSALVIYSAAADETQIVAVEGKAFLENRFQPEARVAIAPGEASSMNFKQLRTVPAAPKAMALASLRAKLGEFQLPQRYRDVALGKAKERRERTFASEIAVKEAQEPQEVAYADEADAQPVRAPASGSADLKVKDSPARGIYAARTDIDPVKRQLVRKLAGGEGVGEEILFPNHVRGKPRKFEVDVEDPGPGFDRAARAQEEKEKRRLIEELSQIKAE